MINELWQLASVLETENIATIEWHRKYKELPKYPPIRLWLNDDGSIHTFETLTAEQAAVVRKYEPDNGKAFPAFNLSPLYRITDKDKITTLEKIEEDTSLLDWQEIRSWCTEACSNWNQKRIGTFNDCLATTPQQLQQCIVSEAGLNTVTALFDILTAYHPDPAVHFRAQLETAIFEKLQKKEDVTTALALLLHHGDPRKEADKDMGKPLTIILDVYNWDRYGDYPIAHENTTNWINEKLLESEKSDDTSDFDAVDAFGTKFKNPEEPMPKVKLGGLSEVTLRSMFDAHRCQSRYQTLNDASFPIAKENRSRIKSALETLFQDDKKGIYWSYLDKDEILFVYPSKLPKIPPAFAKEFSSSYDGARFEKVAEEFSITLSGCPTSEKPDSVRLFVIRKMDKARSKVIFNYSTTPEHLITVSKEWSAGCKNLPPLRWMQEGYTPYPTQIPDIINTIWKQDGTSAQGNKKIKQMKYFQGIELLLNAMPENTLHYYLQITLKNASGLITNTGTILHRGNYDKKKAENCYNICSALGLLLHKCGDYKENYMKNQAYLIGQLLHISDELHAHYCNVVRDGSIPAQLVGSALFVTAQETPTQALSQLSTRVLPYIAWAKQYQYKNIEEKGKESWKAGWYLRLYKETADQLLSELTEKTRFTDLEKAELFLGYLASFPKKENTAQNNGENNGN